MKLSPLLKKLLPLTIGCLFASHVYADTSDASNLPLNEHQGSYGEFNVGSNFFYLGILSNSSSGTTAADGFYGEGWSAAYGYQFNPGGWALEGGFMQNFAKLKVQSDQTNPNTGDTVTIDSNAHIDVPYLAARWEIPIASRFDFITKLGLMYVMVPNQTVSSVQDGATYTATINASNSAIVLPFVGLGLGYAINRNVSVAVQYQGLVIGILGAGLLSAGVDVRF